MQVAIIDYGSGNLRSARKAFERAAADTGVTADIVLTSDPDVVAKSDRVVLPGVGAFRDCKAGLHGVDGMADALVDVVELRARPFFGICVGMQLMATTGYEHGKEAGFGWIDGDVKLITPSDSALKIPHMGWNTLNLHKSHTLFGNIPTGPGGLHAYFVHSYALVPERLDNLIADTDYGGLIAAAIGRDNMFGTQFHPEKSQALGLALIGNFLRWSP